MGSSQPSTGATILVVDDDRAVREALDRALRLEGHRVELAHQGQEALDRLVGGGVDLVVLDVMMPEVDGVTACRRLRLRGDRTPVLVLTARDAVSDRVAGLDAGADDYLPKPFALEELLARVRALLRRTDADTEALSYGGLVLDPARRTVTRDDAPITLTKTEFDLLELLLRNAELVMSRVTIYDRIWGYDFDTGSKSLEVYVGYLRRKTEVDGAARLIHTVRGVGYVLRETP